MQGKLSRNRHEEILFLKKISRTLAQAASAREAATPLAALGGATTARSQRRSSFFKTILSHTCTNSKCQGVPGGQDTSFSFNNASTKGAISSGLVFGSKRLKMLPSLAIRNLVKFHLI